MNGFRRVLAAETVSNFGSMLSRVAIPWLAALALEVEPWQMGLLLVADVAAGAAGTLVLGGIVDRAGKRATMLIADAGRALLLLGLAALAASGRLEFWMLVASAAMTGLLTVAFELARSAWMAQALPADALPRSNAQVAACSSASESAAFALGGYLYQWLGAVVALVVDALSYVASASCLRGVPEVPGAATRSRATGRLGQVLDDAREGLALVRRTPSLRVLAATGAILALGSSLAGTSYMIFVARDIGFETGTLGVIFAAGGIGSLAGAYLSPAWGRRFGSAGAMAAGLALLTLGACLVPLAAAPTIAGGALLVAHQVIGDGGRTLFDIHDRTWRQTAVAPESLARADAGVRTLEQVATLAGALAGGALATMIGARLALALSAALFLAAGLLFAATMRRVAIRP
ncbi:MAG: MFS transporter [Lysobacter sp.]|nr:MFS transporter [Lysobacter sp.]